MERVPTVADDPAVRQLAEAMRTGLESRRSFGGLVVGQPFTGSFSLETRHSLHQHADLLNFPPIAKSGPLSRIFRLLRAVAKALIRPWLGVQTEFNRLALEALQALHQEVVMLKARVEECDEAIEKCYHEAANRELGHTGKIARGGLWFNPPIAVELRQNQPVVVSISERILEHLFVHTRLPAPPARVLDLGCAESVNPIELASFGYQVLGVDLRDLPVPHPSFTMIQADMGHLPFPDDAFDVVVSLSTIEHVGLDWYAPSPNGTTDHGAAEEIRRVLRPGGRLILTVPFGQAATTPVQRVYDLAMLDRLLGSFKRVETLFGIRDGKTWSLTADAEKAGRMNSKERVSAVALVVAERL